MPVDRLPSIATLRAKSHSQVRLGTTTVFLYAADEVVARLSDTTSRGCEGEREWNGHYDVIAVRGLRIVGRLSLGERAFTQHTVHDGLRVAALPGGAKLLEIHQYLTCAGSQVEFYRLATNGRVEPVHVVESDGKNREVVSVSHSGFLIDPRGRAVLCAYDNAHRLTWCDAMRVARAGLVVVDRWALAWPEARSRRQWSRPTQRARARAVAGEFGDALASGRYDEAAGRYQGSSQDLEHICAGCPRASCSMWYEIRDVVSPSPKLGFELRGSDPAGAGAGLWSLELQVGSTRSGLRVMRVSDCRADD
jgi:hypothetical protein